MKKVIHVNRFAIERNHKLQLDDAPLIVRTYKGAVRCHRVHISGPSTLVYNEKKPLSCGARVWLETTAPVEIDNDVA